MAGKIRNILKKLWYFVWEDDSIWSWIANIALAFILIKFVVYPALGFALNTQYPVVAVVSSSMEHKTISSCAEKGIFNNCANYQQAICGNFYNNKQSFGLDAYWKACGAWYEANSITKDQFSKFRFFNGFNKGDIMVLFGEDAKDISIGDIIVFKSSRKDPIIHRVVKKTNIENKIYFQTKGDNNKDSIKTTSLDETSISKDAIIGKAILRIPFLGYIKIWFVELLRLIGLSK